MSQQLLEIGLDKRKFFLILMGLLLVFVALIWATIGISEKTWSNEPGILSVGVAGWFRDLPISAYKAFTAAFAFGIGLAIFWFIFIYIRTDQLESAFSVKIDRTELKVSSFKKLLGTASIDDRLRVDGNKLIIVRNNVDFLEYKLPFPKYLENEARLNAKALEANEKLALYALKHDNLIPF